MRVISAASFSAARRVSPLCSGRVEMLGIRSSSFNSSRNRDWFWRAKSTAALDKKDRSLRCSHSGVLTPVAIIAEPARDHASGVPTSATGVEVAVPLHFPTKPAGCLPAIASSPGTACRSPEPFLRAIASLVGRRGRLSDLSYLFPCVLSTTYKRTARMYCTSVGVLTPDPSSLRFQYRSTAGSTSRDQASIPPRSDCACSNP
jgi:hypothetical protein